MLAMYSLNEEERRQRAVMREVLPNAAMWRKWEKTEAPLRQGRGWYPTLDRHFLELLVISEIATLSHPLGGSTDGIGESSPNKIHRHAVKVRRVACERIGQERLGAYCDRVREAFEAYVSSGGWWVEEEDEGEEGEGESPVGAGDVQEGERDEQEARSDMEGGKESENDELASDASSAWTDVTVTHTLANHGESEGDGADSDDEHHLGRTERNKVDEQVKKLIQGLEAQASARSKGQGSGGQAKDCDGGAHSLLSTQGGDIGQQTYAQAAAVDTDNTASGQTHDQDQQQQETADGQAASNGTEGRGRRMSRDGNLRSPSPTACPRSPSHSPVKTSREKSPATATAGAASLRAPAGLIHISVVSAPTVTIHSPPFKDTVKTSATATASATDAAGPGRDAEMAVISGGAVEEDEEMVDINLGKSRSIPASASVSAASNMLDMHVSQNRLRSAAEVGGDMDMEVDIEEDTDVDMDMDEAIDAEIAAMRQEALDQVQTQGQSVQGHVEGQGKGKVHGKGLRVELDVLDEDEDEVMG